MQVGGNCCLFVQVGLVVVVRTVSEGNCCWGRELYCRQRGSDLSSQGCVVVEWSLRCGVEFDDGMAVHMVWMGSLLWLIGQGYYWRSLSLFEGWQELVVCRMCSVSM